jgi:hypothetical protein
MPMRGACLCGAVTFEVRGTLGGAGHCHCSICRRAHGAACGFHAMPGCDSTHAGLRFHGMSG